MGAKSQRKGASGEQELTRLLRDAGYPAVWGGNRTFGSTPDIVGLNGVHIECKRVEHLNLERAMEQAERDAHRFRDGLPVVIHRRNNEPWVVSMRLEHWLRLYGSTPLPLDRDLNAQDFFMSTKDDDTNQNNKEESSSTTMETPRYWQEEPGKVIDTGKNVLEYYPKAGKLSIAKPSWTNAVGEVKRGKTVVLDLAAVKANPEAVAMFRRIADRLEH